MFHRIQDDERFLDSIIFSDESMFQTASVAYWSEFLSTDPEVWVRFSALPDFLRSSGAVRGSTQPREYNWRATWKKE
jgi:hypothetical protein